MIEFALAALQLASEPVDCREQPDPFEAEPFAHSGEPDYFPFGEVDAFECDWYSVHLAGLQEAPIELGDAQFRLRYLVLPSMAAPVSITVTGNLNGTGEIEFRSTDGFGGYEPGQLTVRERGVLSAREVELVSREILRANLCGSHPNDDRAIKIPGPEPDGSEDTLLVSTGGTMRVFEWITPDRYCLRDAFARQNDQMSKLDFWLFEFVDQLDQVGAMSAVKPVGGDR